MFNKVDTLKRYETIQIYLNVLFHLISPFFPFRGSINKDQFELLLMAMGHNVSTGQLDLYCTDLGIGSDGVLSFDTFFEWWTSDVGVRFVPQAKSSSAGRK